MRDPTWLSEIRQSYEKLVEVLLRSSDPSLIGRVEPQQLQIFREIYGDRSYVCRYRSCASSTNGFNSPETRDQHEAAHFRAYRCDVLGCFMAERGFKKQRELKTHCQKYHPPPKAPELVLDLPPLGPDTSTQDSLALGSLPGALEGLTIQYAADAEQSFSVELLHQRRVGSFCGSVAISPDEFYFAMAGSWDVTICRSDSGLECMIFKVSGVNDLCFTTDSKSLIGATRCGRIMVCVQASMLWLHPLYGRSFVFADGVEQIWDIETQELKANKLGHEADIFSITLSSDGYHVASASDDGTARVWDVHGNEVGKYVTDSSPFSVAFFPDENHLTLGCLDNTFSIVNWRTGSLIEIMKGHTNLYSEIDVLPRSRKIVSASYDQTVRVWSRQETAQCSSPQNDCRYSVENIFLGHEVFARPCLLTQAYDVRALSSQSRRWKMKAG